MPDIITALRADPADPNKVHIFVDGKHMLAVTLDVAAAEKLSVGQPCPPSRLEKLHSAEELQSTYESAIHFLSYRPRSAREVELRLRKKGHSPEQIAAVMDRLRAHKYVDDTEFARFWVSNRMSFSPRGPRLLRSELRQKGVSQEVIDAVLQEQVEEQAEAEERATEIAEIWGGDRGDEPTPGSDLANALSLAQKKWRTYGRLDPQTARRRLSGFLMRRGYDYATVDSVLQRLVAGDDNEILADD